RFAYSALLDVATGVLVHVDSEGQYQGAVSHALLQQVLEGAVGVRPHD
ncbi:TPA: ABC transporter ATP-binding protein, partial [Klebsiella quasipneumoniae subsp. quasipneumoniae]|nr:ABC transporter ATP-binding protein [Klebsiella quasipneumoniae subsp. quasipneumoniae]